MSLERLIPGTDGWEKYNADHVQRYAYFSQKYKGKHVLDMACGAGYGSAIINGSGAASVTGLDIADEAVSFATKNYAAEQVNFHKLDYRQAAALNKSFDVVVSFETIEHVPDPADFIAVAASVLKPGGKMIVSTPNKSKYSAAGMVNPFHLSELYYEEFVDLFSRHFTIEHTYHQTESINYQRWLHLKQEMESLKWNYSQLPFARLKRFVKSLVGKQDPREPDLHGINNLHPGDFVLEEMASYKDHYSVIILEGVKR